MKFKTLEKRIKALTDKSFQVYKQAVIKLINEEYLKGNDVERDISNSKIEGVVDEVCLFGAWIEDKIQGNVGTTHHPTYKKSRTKKIRKALGFNI